MNRITQTPFYNPELTYEENYSGGPFGAFADEKMYKQKGEPTYEFLGRKVFFPFGIPAGPLLNNKYVKAAFEKGFDICVYKTVRSNVYPCHAFPNVLSVHFDGPDLTFGQLKKGVLADTNYQNPLSITNSFNIPSRKPEIWQEDMKKAALSAGKGQVVIGSFVGTVRQNQTPKEFIEDWAIVAKQVLETDVKIVEADISCPNNGAEGLVCYNLDVTEKICKNIRNVIGNTPLILKVGYYGDEKQLEKLAEIANEYADDVAGINTLQAKLINADGEQVLPGPNRLYGGVCGSGIKWAGLNFVKRLKKIKEDRGFKFSITGIGGVVSPDDYEEYRKAGADTVMSATGAMWNPYLAQEIKQKSK